MISFKCIYFIFRWNQSKGKKLVNIKYGSTFKLKSNDWTKVCIKRGSLKNIKKVYTSNCSEDDYKDEIDFSYSDTVGWL